MKHIIVAASLMLAVPAQAQSMYDMANEASVEVIVGQCAPFVNLCEEATPKDSPLNAAMSPDTQFDLGMACGTYASTYYKLRTGDPASVGRIKAIGSDRMYAYERMTHADRRAVVAGCWEIFSGAGKRD